jgi:uncharacterized protein YkwD
MPVRKHRSLKLLAVFAIFTATITILSAASAHHPSANTSGRTHRQYLAVLFSSPAATHTSPRDLINQIRFNAGVPEVRYSPILEKNCFEHARYMAENAELTHEQNPDLPYASSSGQICASQADLWLGSAQPTTSWESDDAIKGWMSSVSHRIWLLYPTTEVFGYSFYTSPAANRAAAALDILSGANFAADEAYAGWPVRYPGRDQKNIPATRFPITLNWRYFGPEPVLKNVRLTTADGTIIPHEATTQMSIGHKGIQIIPKTALPMQSKINVSVEGQYDGAPFSYSWQFYTGSLQYTDPITEAAVGH